MYSQSAATLCYRSLGFVGRRGEWGICASEYAIMGGCNGTSNMYAARKLGILPVGTMAHSFVLSVVDTPKHS